MTAYAETRYTTRVIATDRGNYWRYYGLTRDPFLPIVEDCNFFLPTCWEQHFDLLQYLCESSNVLLSIIGSKGSGKTSMVRQFMAQVSGEMQLTRLVGSNILTIEQLKNTLVRDFNLPQPTGETVQDQLETLVVNMQSAARPFLLVIDDAHRLPAETQHALLSLIRHQSEHQMRLHILLAGEAQLATMLSVLTKQEDATEFVHSITLEAFNLADTEGYVKHRMQSVGLPGALPLRPAEIARIYKLSEGVPGRINAVARQVLIDGMQQGQLYGISSLLRWRNKRVLGGAVILAGLLSIAYMIPHGNINIFKSFNRPAIEAENNEAAIARVTANEHEVVIPTTIIGEPSKPAEQVTQHLVAATDNQPPVVKLAPAKEIAKADITSDIQTIKIAAEKANNPKWYAAKTVTFNHAAIETQAAEQIISQTTAANNPAPVVSAPIVATPIAAPATIAKVAQIPTPVIAAPAKTTVVANNVVAKEETVQPAVLTEVKTPEQNNTAAFIPATLTQLTVDSPELAKSHYSVQLIGVSSEKAMKQFIAKNQISGSAYYYRTNYKGKDWYVLMYGMFDTRKAANAALSSLPEAVRTKQTPWLRTMVSVKQSVNRGLQAINTAQTQLANVDGKTTTASDVKDSDKLDKTTNDAVNIPAIN